MLKMIETQNINTTTDKLAIPGTDIRIDIEDVSPDGTGYYNITTQVGDVMNLLPNRKVWIERNEC